MSLPVAIQSVIFFYLSCSPCNKVYHHHKTKIQAKKERQEKHQLETEQPGLYRHPSPFQTNPYWHDEIQMGPGPPPKKGKKVKNGSQRALNSAGVGSSIASSEPMSSDPTDSRISGEGWNRKRYQREDEALWGHDAHWPGQRLRDAITRAGTSAGRIIEARLSKIGPSDEPSSDSEEGPAQTFYPSKNPPVNDLHPPVVSTRPASKAETAWMLQPPPSAKIMEGKERVDSVRSRADSGASSRIGVNTPLGRRFTEKMVDSKFQRGETSPYLEARPSSSRPISRMKTTSSTQFGHRHGRDESSSSISSLEGESVKRMKRKPPPIAISPAQRSSRETVEHISVPASTARPTLSTIASSSYKVPQMDDTLVLRELYPTAANSRGPSPTKAMESRGTTNKPFIFPERKSTENERPTVAELE